MSTVQVDRWVEIARMVFPDGAQITHPPAGESIWFKVRWKVGTDPKRPHKPAKGVNLYFTREFCKAYERLEPGKQSDWDNRVRDMLATKYKAFEPDHNSAHGDPVPVESWFVTSGAVR